MKVYISADMEGVTGVSHWDEVDHAKPQYSYFQKQMSKEVAAACEGANAAGAERIYVKDAHYSARNIIPAYLPENVKIIRGWSGHPYSMVQGLNNDFDALMMVGYHSRAGSSGNPLAHTMSSAKVDEMILNDKPASELLLHGTIASKYQVPLVFVSGDFGICKEAKLINPLTITHSAMKGIGNSTISIQPELSRLKIKKKAEKSLSLDLKLCTWAHPKKFKLEIKYMKHVDAYKAAQYPGTMMLSPKRIVFENQDYDNIMRFVLFCV